MPPRPDISDAVSGSLSGSVPGSDTVSSSASVTPAGPSGVPADWPLALRLLIALCRTGAVSGSVIGEAVEATDHGDATGLGPADQQIAALARAMTARDWEDLATLAVETHRVAPVIAPGATWLAEAQSDIHPGAGPAAARIAAAARAATVEALGQIAETRRIAAALAPLGVEPVVLKGWPLAERLYGSAAGRHAKDLDLLIPPAAAGTCLEALQGLGYRAIPDYRVPRSPRARRALRVLLKDTGLVHPERHVSVELHWRALGYRGWPDPLAGPGGLMHHGGDGTGAAVRVLCPSDAANLAYLSVHGVVHRWNRLKWLLDIDRLARRMGPGGVAAALGTSRVQAVRPPVLQALRLSGRLFATPLPALPRARFETAQMARIARAQNRRETGAGALAERFWPLLMARTGGQAFSVLHYNACMAGLVFFGLVPPVLGRLPDEHTGL